ncbi:MAG: ATP-dependent Clp protease ATP-binding subunit [Chloroflexi bacterium]|nr:ATP-dependent Clp protease ATP-binding subunit [Chloroflexota bacterium]MBU1751878.1 ATP-dependent Clp protease ATP-binding subunit [Chloroflexota bacterium]
MGSGFDKFSDRARQALRLARDEAQRLGHDYIGTEHLLLGLLREGHGLGAQALIEMGVRLEQVREAVEFTVGSTPAGPQPPDPVLTPKTKRVIELAVDEARQMGYRYIGTEHLLLGLLREADSIAVGILESQGISPKTLRSKVQHMIGHGSREKPTEQAPESKTPYVDSLGLDLTAAALEHQLDPVIGRHQEIDRVMQVLARRAKNNPALIGEPGVGKTAIVEGLAQRIVADDVPDVLLGKRLLMLDLGRLVAGTKYRGEFEERIKRVVDEIRHSANILFIDELHTLIGAGAAEGALDAANILKPALARGELQCIGATTLDEYRKHIERDAALERRFQPIMVEEPTIEETVDILRGIKSRYEDFHDLLITDEAVQSAAELSARYVPDRYLPDKAIDLIDEAAARVRIFRRGEPSLKRCQHALTAVAQERETALQALDYERVTELETREHELRAELYALESTSPGLFDRPIVDQEHIAEIVSMWTGIPVVRIAGDETARLLQMEDALHRRIVGQDEAIGTISRAVRRARAGLKDPRRPIGSFIFLGPTGVGKTELAKALSEFLFGSEEALVQLDMSEFMERHSVARLVGAPPGYIGYEDAGQLTEAVRRKPYCVICFDEVEKAHPEVWNMLLQILEDGHLSDAKGRRVDFRNAIILMTSNVGATLISQETQLGFAARRDEGQPTAAKYAEMRRTLMEELKRTFRPEFLNRVDAVVVFRALARADIVQIADFMLQDVNKRLREHNLTLQTTDAAREWLAEHGYDQHLGARPLRRVIQSQVEDLLSEKLLAGDIHPGDTVQADLDESGDKLRIGALTAVRS